MWTLTDPVWEGRALNISEERIKLIVHCAYANSNTEARACQTVSERSAWCWTHTDATKEQ